LPMDPNYKPFHPNPSKPGYKPPAGAVDAHCHVFGPEAVFPYHPDRKYTPCDASKEQLFALRDFLGFDKNVIVQASCHGPDNRALIDALVNSNGNAKGVAVVDPEVTDAELKAMDAAGVKGVRFNFVPRLADEMPAEEYRKIAERIKPLGWHIVVYFEESEIERLTPLFNSLGVPIVIDHMGTPDMSKPVDNPKFNALQAMLAGNKDIWVKVTCPERLSVQGPPYDDFVPFARTLVERFPDQVLWGTDWPHPNMRTHVPDDGQLVDMIPRIAVTEEAQRKLLIDNPMKLYWS
jgi:2-pyrone-4,6-dicarboxylate lactonase